MYKYYIISHLLYCIQGTLPAQPIFIKTRQDIKTIKYIYIFFACLKILDFEHITY